MDIGDGRYLSILKSDIRLIYSFIFLDAITSGGKKKKEPEPMDNNLEDNRNLWTTNWRITGTGGQQIGG
jgi:hypothetical protein